MMREKRIKSDFKRFNEINKYLFGKEILDMGSSEGQLHSLLKKNNPDKVFFTMGFDKNSDFLMNLDKPKKIKEKFDSVIAGEIIEHIESPISFIKYCCSLIKKNGRLILTTPNAIGIQYLINQAWCVYNYKEYRGHTQTFTLDMLKRMCQDEGLKVLYGGYINAFWNNNPLKILSGIIKRLRTDLIIVCEKT